MQRVLHSGPCPIRTVAVDTERCCQFVGGLKANAMDVVGQLVWVLLDLGDGLVPVGAVDADGPARCNSMLGQKEHDLADFFLLVPTLPDSLESLCSDAIDVQEHVGIVLENVECAFLVDRDNLSGEFGTNAADSA